METCQASFLLWLSLVCEIMPSPAALVAYGGVSSSKSAEPHSLIAQAGASRSGAGGVRERREARLWDLRRLGWKS